MDEATDRVLRVGSHGQAEAWALTLSFAAVTVLSGMFFFTIPIVFSSVITVCLVAAAWRSGGTES